MRLKIISVIYNIIPYGVGEEVPGRLLFFDKAADEGGRDIEEGGVHYMDMRALGRRNCEARAIVHYHLVLGQQLLIVLPLGNVLEGVCAHDYRKLLKRELFAQVSEGVNGVRGLGKVELYIGGPELGIVFYGQLYQVQAVVFVQQVVRFLEGILRCEDKPYLIYAGVLLHMIGNNKMPDVDRIEGAEVQADMHRAAKLLQNDWKAIAREGNNVGTCESP